MYSLQKNMAEKGEVGVFVAYILGLLTTLILLLILVILGKRSNGVASIMNRTICDIRPTT